MAGDRDAVARRGPAGALLRQQQQQQQLASTLPVAVVPTSPRSPTGKGDPPEPAPAASHTPPSPAADADSADSGWSARGEPSPGHPRCMPCSGMRLMTSPMTLVVVGLSALTYYPYVITNADRSLRAVAVIVVFHVLLALMWLAYLQAVFTDAGSVPGWWRREVERRGDQVAHVHCSKTGLTKPPRAHFDSITQRHVLNMDHFCPWVANTVGFYNRKYFVLFLLYCSLTCLWATLTMATMFSDQALPTGWRGCGRTGSGRFGTPRRLRGYSGRQAACGGNFQVLMLIALIFDATFGVMLACFSAFHIQMALTNETTIETARDTSEWKYNVGPRRNWEQVFGRRPGYWLLPVWGDGPAGDGLRWPTRDDLLPTHHSAPDAGATGRALEPRWGRTDVVV